jgi:Lipase (class 3)
MNYCERVLTIVVAVLLFFVVLCLVCGGLRVKSALAHAWWGNDYKEATKDMIYIDDALFVPQRASKEYSTAEARLHADIISRIEQAAFLNTDVYMHPAFVDYKLVGNMGIHAVKGRVSRIAFRGTANTKEMRENMNYAQVPFLGPDARVHRGFLRTYTSMLKTHVLAAAESAVENGHTLVLSGHSLGAAIANMAALDVKHNYPELQVVVYAFAPPRQGNAAYAKMLTENVTAHQIINLSDLVTGVPMAVTPNFLNPKKPFIYEHGGQQYVFNQLEPRRFLVDLHLLTAYQQNL